MAMVPDDLQFLRNIEFVDLNRDDYEYLDVGMKKIVRGLKQAGGRVPVVHTETSGSAAEPLGASSHLSPKSSPTRKRYAAFISHFKKETGTEARLVQMRLQDLLPAGSKEVFLDSDHLNDLRMILEHVKSSDVLVLLQSTNVLTRPWVILELYSAVAHGVPIVAMKVNNAKLVIIFAQRNRNAGAAPQ